MEQATFSLTCDLVEEVNVYQENKSWWSDRSAPEVLARTNRLIK